MSGSVIIVVSRMRTVQELRETRNRIPRTDQYLILMVHLYSTGPVFLKGVFGTNGRKFRDT